MIVAKIWKEIQDEIRRFLIYDEECVMRSNVPDFEEAIATIGNRSAMNFPASLGVRH
jgi:hypothetical protein